MGGDIDSREHDQLFRQLLEGEMTDAEFAGLEQQLKEDPSLRSRYVQFVDLETCLQDELSHRAETSLTSPKVKPVWPWYLAAVVATAAGLLLAVNLFHKPEQVAIVPLPPLPVQQAPALYMAAPLQGLPVVAVVTALDGVTQPELRDRLEVGTRLKSGILKLTDGEVQLDFLGGARLLLSAPAELHMVSNSSATLVSGAAGVRVLHAQKNFVLNAPDVAVVDLGTEFAVRVDARQTQVHVYAGEVEISMLGDDGNTLISQRLAERGTMMVDPQSRLFTPLAAPTTPLPRVRAPVAADLVVTREYVQQVQQSKPYLYWRFDSMVDGVVPDESGNSFDAHVVAAPEDAGAIRIANGVLALAASSGPRSLVTVNPVPNFNSDDFSLELWVMPAELSQAVVLGVLLPNENPIPMHLNLIELAHNTALVHQPGVIRFLHRQPARRLGGFNLFSQDVCTPGTWTHVVATKAIDELKLYVNGQLIRTVSGPGTGARDDLSYNIMLGQLAPTNKDRQFNGLIDEVAVYRRVMPVEEISRHYWSIVRPSMSAASRPRNSSSIVASSSP
ncbi:MAG: FecR protein [Schlesneria sp.]|nr:FecR protein [Schlesneria sp.]